MTNTPVFLLCASFLATDRWAKKISMVKASDFWKLSDFQWGCTVISASIGFVNWYPYLSKQCVAVASIYLLCHIGFQCFQKARDLWKWLDLQQGCTNIQDRFWLLVALLTDIGQCSVKLSIDKIEVFPYISVRLESNTFVVGCTNIPCIYSYWLMALWLTDIS